jgi:hypothetical protein
VLVLFILTTHFSLMTSTIVPMNLQDRPAEHLYGVSKPEILVAAYILWNTKPGTKFVLSLIFLDLNFGTSIRDHEPVINNRSSA